MPNSINGFDGLNKLREQVYRANMLLPKYGLVLFTWGNVSGIDRRSGTVIIKPSGIPYEELKASDMTAVDLETGEAKSGSPNPSSDTQTHLELYRNYKDIGGITHTHSRFAVIFAQAARGIPVFGTTHADYFYGEIPCTRRMTEEEIKGEYEAETGKVIIETFRKLKINPSQIPGALAASHGPFTWGGNPEDAVHNSVILEEIALMAWHSLSLNPGLEPVKKALLDRHYRRKHGKDAYYGQK